MSPAPSRERLQTKCYANSEGLFALNQLKLPFHERGGVAAGASGSNDRGRAGDNGVRSPTGTWARACSRPVGSAVGDRAGLDMGRTVLLTLAPHSIFIPGKLTLDEKFCGGGTGKNYASFYCYC